MLALLNAGLTPVVPEHGSLGASGDLAPLAHCALGAARRGRGAGRPTATRVPAADGAARGRASSRSTLTREGGPRADQRHRRDPRDARSSPCTTSRRCCKLADVTAAMSRRGAARHRPRLRRRPESRCARSPGQAASAANLRAAARRVGDRRQPPPRRRPRAGRLLAALRAAGERRRARHARPRRAGRRPPSWRRRSTTRWSCPTAGSSRAATSTARRSAFACDFLAIAAAEVGAIAERRTDRLLDAARSHGLPPFLADGRGRRTPG